MVRIRTLAIASIAIILSLRCHASDQGPKLEELDTRSDKELLEIAQTKLLLGSWYSSNGQYPVPMVITKTHFSELGCKAPYSIVKTSIGKTYPNNGNDAVLVVGRYLTVKINHKKCKDVTEGGFLQFSFVTTNPDYSFALINQYDENDRHTGRYSLGKRTSSER